MSYATKINWTEAKLKEFKGEYDKHKDRADKTFTWHGHTFQVAYAMYLIEFLETEQPWRS